MMTVKEASRLTGISIRTLQYYDKLGLLPAMRTESGYRLYDDAALERLQQILLFRELEFPLRDIRTILDNPNFDRRKALRQQIELLTLKKQHLEDLIRLARTLQVAGGHTMQFKEFDTSRIDEYTRRAKESWGNTPAYREFEQNAAERTVQESSDINNQLMAKPAHRQPRRAGAGRQAASFHHRALLHLHKGDFRPARPNVRRWRRVHRQHQRRRRPRHC